MHKVKVQKDVIEVKKNGISKMIKIDPTKNLAKESEIQQILQKNECMDIFKDIVLDKKMQIFDQQNYNDFIRYKFRKKSRKILYNKIKLMMEMNIIHGLLYIEGILAKI